MDDYLETCRKALQKKAENMPGEITEKTALSSEKAVALFLERGWVQIFSKILNKNIYLVHNRKVEVPDPELAKYTHKEFEAWRGLKPDEIRILHEAKVIFDGKISMPEANRKERN